MSKPLVVAAAALIVLVACQPPAKQGAEGDKPTKPAADVKSPMEKPVSQDLPAPDDVAGAPADAEKTASGLASRVLQKGTGQTHPAAADTVEVHYTGWTKDGKMFDSSVKRGRTAKFPLNRVIKGWTEGLQLMVEGEKRRFWIPSELAYGDNGRVPGQLTFDVELIKIVQAPKPLQVPPPPPDVKAPPKDAKKTASGLAYKNITKGTGQARPVASDTVEVHYAGWTTDGKMFDNSYERGQTIKFPLGGVIKGWTEGVQLMVAGDKTRFWIPAGMAYGENPGGGRPGGTLVFDIELVAIQGK